jgi:hypothetical protein
MIYKHSLSISDATNPHHCVNMKSELPQHVIFVYPTNVIKPVLQELGNENSYTIVLYMLAHISSLFISHRIFYLSEIVP